MKNIIKKMKNLQNGLSNRFKKAEGRNGELEDRSIQKFYSKKLSSKAIIRNVHKISKRIFMESLYNKKCK